MNIKNLIIHLPPKYEPHILVSWIGISDARGAAGELRDDARGPIYDAIIALQPAAVHLLTDFTDHRPDAVRTAISDLMPIAANIHITRCVLKHRTDYDAIARAASVLVDGLHNTPPAGKHIYALLTSGTSAMDVCWALIAQHRPWLTLLHHSSERGVRLADAKIVVRGGSVEVIV